MESDNNRIIENDIFNFNSITEDFGRESLGILDFNKIDFRRESFGTFSYEFGRESLGIIDVNNSDFRRDTLFGGFNLPKDENSFLGRESMGILDMNNSDFRRDTLFGLNLPKDNFHKESIGINVQFPGIVISNCDENKAVLPATSSPSWSEISTIPSRIYSVSSSVKSDLLNDGFIATTSDKVSVSSLKSPGDDVTTSHKERFISLPDFNSNLKPLSDVEVNTKNVVEREGRKFLSFDDKLQNKEKKRERRSSSFSGPYTDTEDHFNDSVFIEAKNLASRIADGSILDETISDDMLDSIHEPDNLAGSVSAEEIKYDTETVFKTVDKMLPLPQSKKQIEAENYPEIKIVENTSVDEKLEQNNSSTDTSLVEPHNIITKLAAILDNKKFTDKEKAHGEKIMKCLTEILTTTASSNKKSSSLDDSGNSSVENEPVNSEEKEHRSYEVLDLRSTPKSTKSVSVISCDNNPAPLDLSLKSNASEKQFLSPRPVANKGNDCSQKSGLSSCNNSITRDSNSKSLAQYSVSSNDNSDCSTKFRPRKAEINLKKGPMKAVLSVDNMARRRSAGLKIITPSRYSAKSLNYKFKKTSTPTNERPLKPIAQSTPDGAEVVSTPLKAPTDSGKNETFVKQRLNYSGSLAQRLSQSRDSLNQQTRIVRTNSVSEMKKPEGQPCLVRSFSTGKDSKILSTLDNVRKEVARKRHSTSSVNANETVLKDNKNRTLARRSYVKPLGKENAVH